MKTFRSILASIFSVLVLISSTSFMVGIHFCMGHVENIALFTKAEGCEKEKSLPPCHKHIKIPCCEDETVVHKADDVKAPTFDIQIVAPTDIKIEHPYVLISEVIPSAPLLGFHYYDYNPPLRSYDLTVEHQVFLI
jgi:hypothetical protein